MMRINRWLKHINVRRDWTHVALDQLQWLSWWSSRSMRISHGREEEQQPSLFGSSAAVASHAANTLAGLYAAPTTGPPYYLTLIAHGILYMWWAVIYACLVALYKRPKRSTMRADFRAVFLGTCHSASPEQVCPSTFLQDPNSKSLPVHDFLRLLLHLTNVPIFINFIFFSFYLFNRKGRQDKGLLWWLSNVKQGHPIGEVAEADIHVRGDLNEWRKDMVIQLYVH